MGVINYADKYSNILDEKFKVESKSDIAVNQDYDFVGAKTVKIQSVNTVELSNYTRSGSNRYGTPNELDNAIQEMTMSQDKSFTFTIDKMNEDETNGALNAGKALNRQIRERVIPAVDAYRFGVMANNAGHKETLTLSASNVYGAIVDATSYFEDADGNIILKIGNYGTSESIISIPLNATKLYLSNRKVSSGSLTGVANPYIYLNTYIGNANSIVKELKNYNLSVGSIADNVNKAFPITDNIFAIIITTFSFIINLSFYILFYFYKDKNHYYSHNSLFFYF